MAEKENSIISGPIFPILTKFAFPILLSLILQALYGAVDLWMVGRFAHNADVSAVATGSQTLLIASGMITGLSMGITILLGRATGERDEDKCASIIGTGIWLFSSLAFVLTLILISAAKPIASALNAPDSAFTLTVDYIRICGMGIIFIVAYNVLNAIFCGLGDSKTPLYFVAIACVVNIIGDWFLIDIMKMGARGAAIATIAAQAVSVVSTLFMMKRKLRFRIGRSNLKFSASLALSTLKLGTPVALLRMCNEISYLVILGFVNTLGEVASSGVGIAEKLVMFILLVPTAYMSAVSAFTAQNIGAGKSERAEKTLWVSIMSATVIGGLLSYLSFFHGDMLSRLFIEDGMVVDASSEFLKATAIECFLLSIAYCFDGYFNGRGYTKLVMIRGMAASLLVRIPYAYFASMKAEFSLFNIGLSTSFAALFILLFCILEYEVRKHVGRKRI